MFHEEPPYETIICKWDKQLIETGRLLRKNVQVGRQSLLKLLKTNKALYKVQRHLFENVLDN